MAGTSSAKTRFALWPGHDVGNYYLLRRSDSEFLLLRRRHLGVGGLGRVRLGVGLRRVGGGLVHTLDLGALAQLRHVVGLRLARHIGLDLALDLVKIRRLALSLFLDLDDVPAELRLHAIGDL